MIARMWRVPVLLAVLTVAGVVIALTGDGWRDACAWLGLLAPVAAAGRAFLNRDRGRTGAAR